jgi:hypothetical protein
VRGRGAAVKYLAHNPSRNAGSVYSSDVGRLVELAGL